jgi:hypothetical protein
MQRSLLARAIKFADRQRMFFIRSAASKPTQHRAAHDHEQPNDD